MDPNTDVTAAPDEPGTNDAGTEGAQTQGAQTEVKTFTQEQVNEIVKARLAEKEKTLKTKHEKELETKLAETRDAVQKDLDRVIEERVTARLVEQELAKTRATIQETYGLSEEQAARLQGATPEELAKDAETIFGPLKQRPTPPVIKTGSASGGLESPMDVNQMTPAEIRKNRDKLWSSVRVP